MNKEQEERWRRIAMVARASGFVSVQTDCSLREAIALMNERSKASGQSVEDLADDIVERRVRFN